MYWKSFEKESMKEKRETIFKIFFYCPIKQLQKEIHKIFFSEKGCDKQERIGVLRVVISLGLREMWPGIFGFRLDGSFHVLRSLLIGKFRP